MKLVRYCVFVLLSGAASLLAQEAPTSTGSVAPDNPTLTLKSTVRRVVVDVVVTDHKHEPVRGLRAQDFTIFEDGKPQAISSLDFYQEPTRSADTTARPDLPPNTFTNFSTVPEKAPINVILLDLLNTSLLDQMYAYQAAVKFAEQLTPGTRTAVFLLKDQFRMIQGVTEDRDRVLASLRSKSAWPYLSRLRSFERMQLTVSSFTSLTRFLSAMPERKNLIWLSDNFFYTPSESLYGGEASLVSVGAGGRLQNWGMESSAIALKEGAALLSIGQIAIYPIDVRGLTIFSFFGNVPPASGDSDPRTINVLQPRPCPTPGLCSPANSASSWFDFRQINMEELAKQSGGHAFLNQNRPQLAMMEAVSEGSNYYSISYAPSNPKFDGSLRKIRVEVPGKEYQLEYRRSYLANDPAELLKGEADRDIDPVFTEAQHGLPLSHQVVFVASVTPKGSPEKAKPEQMDYIANFEVAKLELAPKYNQYQKKLRKARHGKPAPLPPTLEPMDLQHYEISYALPVRELVLSPAAGGKQRVRLDFVAIAYDEDGRKLTGNLGEVDELITAERYAKMQKNGYRARQEVDVPVRAASLRIALRDATGGRMGSLEIPLPLTPALSKEAE